MEDRVKNAMDKGEGKTDEMAGRGKQALGGLTGDEKTRSEGAAQETGGKAKGFIAAVKDKFKGMRSKGTG